MKEIFDEFDVDKGGTINVQELEEVIKKLSGGIPVPKSEIEAIMQEVDTDGSGKIDFAEFCKLMEARSDPLEEMKAAFAAFDTDGSGSISVAEAKQLLDGLGMGISDAEIEEIMQVADTDGSGELSFEEFEIMMKSCNASAMAKIHKAALMAGVAFKMKKLVLNGGVIKKGVFCFRECSYDIKNDTGYTVSAFGCRMSLGPSLEVNKTIISGISGSVETGRMLAVIGPSGGGKTTLMNMLRLKPGPGVANGSITFNGIPFTKSLYQQHAASVEQGAAFWPMLTAREQLNYTFELMRPALDANERKRAIDEMLESLGLTACQHVKAGSGLSGGELRRLSLCAALAKRPSLLFLDEPTTGLDSASAAGVMDVVSQLAKMANTAVICVIHQPSEAVFDKFDKVPPGSHPSAAASRCRLPLSNPAPLLPAPLRPCLTHTSSPPIRRSFFCRVAAPPTLDQPVGSRRTLACWATPSPRAPASPSRRSP